MQQAATLFRLLSDATRLRLLRALAQDRFNVSELTAILGVAQSTVSRHLALLRDAALVDERREGGFVYYRRRDDDPASAPLWNVLAPAFATGAGDASLAADDARMQEVLRRRREEFGGGGDPRHVEPGRSWAAWARAMGHLLPPLDVADIGCGDGSLTLEMARWARHVTGIDRSDDALERAKGLSHRHELANVTWKKGDLSRLPLQDESVDLAVFVQSLRYASDPERAVAEAARILRPGGRLLVLDLKAHGQAWVRARFGAQRPGFAEGELEALLQDAGLRGVRFSIGARRAGNPFVVVIVSGTAPHRTSVRGGDATAWRPRNRMR